MANAKLNKKAPSHLTERAILNMAAGGKKSDELELPGGGRLIVRSRQTVHGQVVREFFFRYRPGQSGDRTIAIGRHGAGRTGGCITLAEAREKAATMSELLRYGKDPQAARIIEREENRRAQQQRIEAIEFEARNGTFADLLTCYVEYLRAQGKASAADTENTFARHVLKPFPHLAVRKAKEIAVSDIS